MRDASFYDSTVPPSAWDTIFSCRSFPCQSASPFLSLSLALHIEWVLFINELRSDKKKTIENFFGSRFLFTFVNPFRGSIASFDVHRLALGICVGVGAERVRDLPGQFHLLLHRWV